MHPRVIAELVTTYRLPAIFPLSLFTASGGLLSYGVDLLKINASKKNVMRGMATRVRTCRFAVP